MSITTYSFGFVILRILHLFVRFNMWHWIVPPVAIFFLFNIVVLFTVVAPVSRVITANFLALRLQATLLEHIHATNVHEYQSTRENSIFITNQIHAEIRERNKI